MKKQFVSTLLFLTIALFTTKTYTAPIFIKDLRGKTYIVDVEKTDTIGKIRDAINQQNPALNNNFNFIVSGSTDNPRIAEDSETVEKLDLYNQGKLIIRYK